MKAITLLYHDVTDAGCSAASGFNRPGADLYKLSKQDFERHLDAIEASGHVPTLTIDEVLRKAGTPRSVPVLLSFDDGGASAPSTADMLERRGWKGHFFITTDFIGTTGFVDKDAVRDLHTRGHVVGSHSCSHPQRISHLADADLEREWAQSVDTLQQIVGAELKTGSVPGGFYSQRVATFAWRAGIRTLFTSEPMLRITQTAGCATCGRFGLQRDSPADLARRYAQGDSRTLLREAAFWNIKKLLKAAGGEQWLTFRKWWLAR